MSQIRDGLKYFGVMCLFLEKYACVDIVLVDVYGAKVLRTMSLASSDVALLCYLQFYVVTFAAS